MTVRTSFKACSFNHLHRAGHPERGSVGWRMSPRTCTSPGCSDHDERARMSRRPIRAPSGFGLSPRASLLARHRRRDQHLRHPVEHHQQQLHPSDQAMKRLIGDQRVASTRTRSPRARPAHASGPLRRRGVRRLRGPPRATSSRRSRSRRPAPARAARRGSAPASRTPTSRTRRSAPAAAGAARVRPTKAAT